MADEIPEAALDAAAAEVVNHTLGADVYGTFVDFQRAHWRKALAKAAPHLTAERDTEITRLRAERDDLRGVVTRLTDQLVYLLAAADQTWSAETGDETSSPDYIRHLADGVTALHEPPVAARPDCGHPDCACCRYHSTCRDGCGNCTEPTPTTEEG